MLSACFVEVSDDLRWTDVVECSRRNRVDPLENLLEIAGERRSQPLENYSWELGRHLSSAGIFVPQGKQN